MVTARVRHHLPAGPLIAFELRNLPLASAVHTRALLCNVEKDLLLVRRCVMIYFRSRSGNLLFLGRRMLLHASDVGKSVRAPRPSHKLLLSPSQSDGASRRAQTLFGTAMVKGGP